MCHKGVFLLLFILLFFPLFSFFISCSREASTGQRALGGAATLAWVPHSCSPLGVLLPQHGSPRAAVPPAQSVFPATFPVLHILPLVAGTGMLKSLLNLPEVFGGDGLFMLVSEASGTRCGHLRAACHTGHLCNPLPPNPCSRCPICSCSAGFSNLVLKF